MINKTNPPAQLTEHMQTNTKGPKRNYGYIALYNHGIME